MDSYYWYFICVKKIFKIPSVTSYISKCKFNLRLFTISVVFIKSFLITVVFNVVTNLAFENEPDEDFFDILFVTVLLSVFVILTFVYFFEDYISSIQEKHRLTVELTRNQAEKAIAKYLSLKKQLNPHFLFNSFNSLLSLISIDPKEAETFVTELSSIYRYNLSHSDDIVVKVSEELKMIHSYIHLQKIRFGDALKYEEISKIDTNKYLLPPMSLQLLVENAIKHNTVNNAKPLCITIQIEDNYAIVSNNLQLKESSSYNEDSFGIGMSSIKRQLKLITELPMEITQNANTYIVKLPLIKTELDD